jgi:nucleoside-diphosphate-sugar epimerase
MNKNERVLVTGAGGFIGGHLVADLLKKGYSDIVAADIKPLSEWYQHYPSVDNKVLDLRQRHACFEAAAGSRRIYNLAADMGGMGFIENNKTLCMLSVLINTHLLEAALENGCERYFFASSACVYAADKQQEVDNPGLKESDAYPALPEDGYGWEKLFSERMCRHFREEFKLPTRIARFHNVYGPHGTWDGGREKAPAAITRKMITCLRSGDHDLEIWGDGEQTRSFMYIDDCIRGIHLIADSEDWVDPINLGSAEMVTINQLVDVVERIADIKVNRRYNLDAPKGVRGRSSDNTLIESVFGWEPSISLADGMGHTYRWILQEIEAGSESR